jgi:hypothetical protein
MDGRGPFLSWTLHVAPDVDTVPSGYSFIQYTYLHIFMYSSNKCFYGTKHPLSFSFQSLLEKHLLTIPNFIFYRTISCSRPVTKLTPLYYLRFHYFEKQNGTVCPYDMHAPASSYRKQALFSKSKIIIPQHLNVLRILCYFSDKENQDWSWQF